MCHLTSKQLNYFSNTRRKINYNHCYYASHDLNKTCIVYWLEKFTGIIYRKLGLGQLFWKLLTPRTRTILINIMINILEFTLVSCFTLK